MIELGFVGQPALDAPAWSAWVTDRRASLSQAWERARVNYLVLKQVKQDLNENFPVAVVGEQGQSAESAWTPDLEQQLLDVQEGVRFLLTVADEALAGKRRVAWDPTTADLAFERLPSDDFHVEVSPQGVATLALNSNNQPVHGSGTISAFPIVLISALAAGVAALGIAYLIYEKYADSAAEIESQKTARTLSDAQQRCISTGQCTPEQAMALSKSIYDGARSIVEAEKAKAAQGAVPQTASLVTTLVTGATIIAGIAAIVELLRILGRGRERTPAATT